MIIRIRTCNTNRKKTMEVDVEENIAVEITQSYRLEDNNDRKCRYHHYSYDVIFDDHDDGDEDGKKWYEGMEYAAPDTPETIAMAKETATESYARIAEALALLTEVQRIRFLMYAAGLSTHEIARREGANQKSVHESIEAARKKLQIFYEKDLKDTPSKRP